MPSRNVHVSADEIRRVLAGRRSGSAPTWQPEIAAQPPVGRAGDTGGVAWLTISLLAGILPAAAVGNPTWMVICGLLVAAAVCMLARAHAPAGCRARLHAAGQIAFILAVVAVLPSMILTAHAAGRLAAHGL